MTPLLRSLGISACALATIPATAAAQRRGGDPVPIPAIVMPSTNSDSVVKGAPYSADAITTQTQVLGDGTKIERTVTAKVYRDGVGRLRREQTVLGLASLAPAADGQRVITIIDPVERVTITLDERTRTARRVPRLGVQLQLNGEPIWYVRQGAGIASYFGGAGVASSFGARRLERAQVVPGDTPGLRIRQYFGVQVDPAVEELERLSALLDGLPLEVQARGGRGARTGGSGTATQLGTRQMEGLTVTGRRTTQTIPAGEIGNDRPIEITDEVWESAQLQVVVSLRHSDPRTGTLEYRLSGIVLGEPAADLFTVPSDYTVVEAPRVPTLAPTPPGALAPATPGTRGGGGGGRGGRSGGQQ
jgi:hypothetical protein